MLVGREKELRELLGAAAAALSTGHGWTSLVGGDAGIGKTRLAVEVADRMRGRRGCGGVGGLPAGRRRAAVLALGAAAEPPRARRRAGCPPTASSPIWPVSCCSRRSATRCARRRRSCSCSTTCTGPTGPRCSCWTPSPAHLAAAPVLVLGTYRDTEPDAAARIAGIAAERRLTLRGLSPADLGPALTDATGETITPEVVGALHRRTGGNPFFAAEIVRLLRAEGRWDAADGQAVPSGVRAVLDRTARPAARRRRGRAAGRGSARRGHDDRRRHRAAGCGCG